MHPAVFFVFNLTFIAFGQSILLAMFSFVPAYIIFLTSRFQTGIAVYDYQYFCLEFTLILTELVSDAQQWCKSPLLLTATPSFPLALAWPS
jgi:hypothetical protein